MGKILYSSEELLNILKDYYNNVGYPTQRKFTAKNGLPCYGSYYERFGSFQNAIRLAGIPIKADREKYFNRESLPDEELLEILKKETENKLKNNLFLLTTDEIDNIKNMPSLTTYYSRFGSLEEAYKLIGYDLIQYNNNALEEDMLLKYKELCNKLGRTATSRDIDYDSLNNKGYSCKAYLNHFGTIHNLQKICNVPLTNKKFNQNKIWNLNKEDLISILKEIYLDLERNPTCSDLKSYDFAPPSSYFAKHFGSYNDALKEAGIPIGKTYKTKNGTKCLSSYEYKLARIFEINNIEFKQEVLYKRIIPNLDRNFRFDFKIKLNENIYYVEMFGMTNNDFYDNRTNEKITLCEKYNIPLLEFYPDEFYSLTYKDLYGLLLKKIGLLKAS